jgi:hypothetical protein
MHINTVNIHLGGSALGAAALAALMSFDASGPAATRSQKPAAGILTPPRIGEYWKGQGGVYVGIAGGRDGKPDAHLILPNEDRFAIAPKRAIGTYGVDVSGAGSDHDGMANTIAFAKAGSELCREILEMEADGHKDLFLMSRQDARLCMANVPHLFQKEWYLTSTQSSSHYAWGQHVYDGFQLTTTKKFEALWRPVRRIST